MQPIICLLIFLWFKLYLSPVYWFHSFHSPVPIIFLLEPWGILRSLQYTKLSLLDCSWLLGVGGMLFSNIIAIWLNLDPSLSDDDKDFSCCFSLSFSSLFLSFAIWKFVRFIDYRTKYIVMKELEGIWNIHSLPSLSILPSTSLRHPRFLPLLSLLVFFWILKIGFNSSSSPLLFSSISISSSSSDIGGISNAFGLSLHGADIYVIKINLKRMNALPGLDSPLTRRLQLVSWTLRFTHFFWSLWFPCPLK